MNEHVHRWRIDEPKGPTSEGACACGATRTFSNVGEEWGDYRDLKEKTWKQRVHEMRVGPRQEAAS